MRKVFIFISIFSSLADATGPINHQRGQYHYMKTDDFQQIYDISRNIMIRLDRKNKKYSVSRYIEDYCGNWHELPLEVEGEKLFEEFMHNYENFKQHQD